MQTNPIQTALRIRAAVEAVAERKKETRTPLANPTPQKRAGMSGSRKRLRAVALGPADIQGRNAKCYCGSGKKYKHCCLLKRRDAEDRLTARGRRPVEQEAVQPQIAGAFKVRANALVESETWEHSVGK